MLKNRLLKMLKNSKLVLWGLLALAPMAAMAAPTAAAGGLGLPTEVPDVVTMLLTLDKNFPQLTYMVSGLAYLFGFGIIMKAIWDLKKYTLGVSMTAQNDLRPTLMHLAVGGALIFLPSTIQSLLVTVYGTDAITGYAKLPDTSWQVAQDTLIIFVQFIGLVAVVRGLLHMYKAAHGQSQQNSFTKGIIHLIGGVLSLNIIQTKDILYSTLGLTT
jgi:hypothetical protein